MGEALRGPPQGRRRRRRVCHFEHFRTAPDGRAVEPHVRGAEGVGGPQHWSRGDGDSVALEHLPVVLATTGRIRNHNRPPRDNGVPPCQTRLMARTYWLDVFTVETWEQFRSNGARISGFPDRRARTVSRMNPGDYLLCYVKVLKRWVGVLEVTGAAFNDTSPMWTADVYPARVPVKAVIALDPEYGVPITNMQEELSIFRDFDNPNAWGIRLQGAPMEWKAADGEAVMRALNGASDHPVSRPLGSYRKVTLSRPRGIAAEPGGGNHESDPGETVPVEGVGAEGMTVPDAESLGAG